MKKVILAGGTGFVGKYLKKEYENLGYEVKVIARNHGDLNWLDIAKITGELENSTLLINLAGKTVNCRYNEKNKAEIFSSRTETTEILGEAIKGCKYPPELWINSSTATIYRDARDRPMTEEDGDIGTGFSVEVAKKWEQTFHQFEFLATRQVALRMAIVLGKNGGVIEPFDNLVKFGLGGQQGDGEQMFSWIHIEDLFQIIRFIESNKHLNGVINCSSPNPINNRAFMETFRNVKNIPFGLPAPSLLLKIGAVIIGTETELLLKSRWVLPERLIQHGFEFKFPTIKKALTDILQK
ncbi:TIGR01777 family oxidoreductase [Sphingobacterium bovistauri]|uniref:TIGR01777 family protein n=1 Tax=Sphingobacterium bovistauri TaxID=2781959 RepID=A0ABS7Z8X9_9SPHI|nr:TIGR01777 family oxidoreductase [Sphingobacterium bovistauri]MCA5006653.1 TIGR01777 family protein [Sphingobacterium bovistauri]